MKTAISLTITLAGICLLFACSGCFYLTTSVSKIGVREEQLAVNHILASTNGSIALDCTAQYIHPTVFGNGEEISKTKKFLVGSPEVVLWTVTNAIASNSDVPTNLVKVTDLVYATTNALNWVVILSCYGGRDATPKDLPQEFNGAVLSRQNEAIPYELNGQSFQIQLPSHCYNKNRTSRKWWGYPAQILVFPAIAIDIVGWPYEFYLGSKEFGQAFN